MKQELKLYEVNAHAGHRTITYCVVAYTTTEAEQLCREFHKRKDYISIDWFASRTLATQNDYGSPVPLLLTGDIAPEVIKAAKEIVSEANRNADKQIEALDEAAKLDAKEYAAWRKKLARLYKDLWGNDLP